MSLERYTRLLMDTSSEFPIHFLKIYIILLSGETGCVYAAKGMS